MAGGACIHGYRLEMAERLEGEGGWGLVERSRVGRGPGSFTP